MSSRASSASSSLAEARRVPRMAELALLSLIQEGGVKEFKPVFSRELGYYYPEAFKIAVKYKVRDIDLLEELVKQGVLEKKYYEPVILCPRCGSHDIIPRLKCPFCGSEKIRKAALVSHVKCGAVNEVERLEGVTCRKCGEPLTSRNTVPVGVLYTCTSCGSRFETPHPMFRCASCGAAFDHKDADLLTLYIYEVRGERAPSVAKSLLLEELRETAERMGLSARTSVSVSGRSGLIHPADLVVTDGRKSLTLDVVARCSPDAGTECLADIAKSRDMPNDHRVLMPQEVKERLKAGEGAEGFRDYEDLKEKFVRMLESYFGRKRPA